MGMKQIFTVALSAGLLLSSMTGTAAAQQHCAPRDTVLDNLGSSFGEAPSARGLSSKGNLIELLTGPNGSWTMLITRPNGSTCVIGAGEAWHAVEPEMVKLMGQVS